MPNGQKSHDCDPKHATYIFDDPQILPRRAHPHFPIPLSSQCSGLLKPNTAWLLSLYGPLMSILYVLSLQQYSLATFQNAVLIEVTQLFRIILHSSILTPMSLVANIASLGVLLFV